MAWSAGRPSHVLLTFDTNVVSELRKARAGKANRGVGALLRAWLDESVLPAFVDRILPIDTETALRFAALHVPNQAPFRDAFIAVTALVHGMTVVTRNNKDFDHLENLVVLNPWT